MKVCIFQPEYSVDYSRTDELLQWELKALDRCDPSMDIIVLPEAADVPALARTREEFLASYRKNGPILLQKVAETAKRCNAIIFVNAIYDAPGGQRNTTYVFDRNGKEVGHYFKQHLTPTEVTKRKLDSDYTFDFSEPTIIELEGLRFAFLTCYDLYFYEFFSHLAIKEPDIIIACSHQRSDSHRALEMMTSFMAYHTNAYVLRSSVSMDTNSDIGGASMVVAPDGEILLNLKSEIGMECIEIDPTHKFYKPAGFGNPDAAHWHYIEAGRRPWKYRPAGSAIVRNDRELPYPRTCAHRGIHFSQPENSLAALGAAVGMGADEIEFDLRRSSDGVWVCVHDSDLSRLSNGQGLVSEYTLAELRRLDFGVESNPGFAGSTVATFEEVLSRFSCHTVMNIHIKTVDNNTPISAEEVSSILALLAKYDAKNHAYIMCGNDHVLRQFRAADAELSLCVGAGNEPMRVVERALEIGCQKVQFAKPHLNREMIAKAKENNIICNLFWSDDLVECQEYLEQGIDTILTNNFPQIAALVTEFAATKKAQES